jgi:hypothetical protein
MPQVSEVVVSNGVILVVDDAAAASSTGADTTRQALRRRDAAVAIDRGLRGWRKRWKTRASREITLLCIAFYRGFNAVMKIPSFAPAACRKLACRALVAAALVVSFSPSARAAPACWSLLSSKYGPGIEKSVDEADPCTKLPGLDHKEKFELKSLDLCSAPSGVQINARADLACKSGSHGIIQATLSGQLEASMTVDIGACKVTDAHVGVSGPIGQLLSSVGEIQGLARGFAQRKISEICGK